MFGGPPPTGWPGGCPPRLWKAALSMAVARKPDSPGALKVHKGLRSAAIRGRRDALKRFLAKNSVEKNGKTAHS